jgi:hypothetical protein
VTVIHYQATRLIHDSAVDFKETRRRFEEQLSLLGPLLTLTMNRFRVVWFAHDRRDRW